jgi:phosphatidate phosphatase APP1
VRVTVRFGVQSVEVTTDDEGYLHAVIEFPAMPGISGWQQITAELTGGTAPASGHVLVPSASSEFGIVSDIDDTIVETNAVSLMRMARTVLLQNARGRMAVPGIATAFDVLVAGASGTAGNPVFYVSSSPWNLYDLLIRFLDINRIPVGPLMLQDYGIDDTKLINRPHDDHKLDQIAEIVNRYPSLPFVLIGDSGQRDPEIYREVALGFPGRIRAVFIRDVTSAERDLAVRNLAEELTRLGVATFPFEDAADIVKESRKLGLVADTQSGRGL